MGPRRFNGAPAGDDRTADRVIDSRAVIEAGATIGDNVSIGPFTIVSSGVTIGVRAARRRRTQGAAASRRVLLIVVEPMVIPPRVPLRPDSIARIP